MLYEYFCWWYSVGLRQAWWSAGFILKEITDFFSLEALVRTWFAPWKNDVLTGRNLALSDQIKIWEQNIASRFVGFVVRSFVIVFTVWLLAVVTLLEAIALFIWIVLPILIIGLVMLAVERGMR